MAIKVGTSYISEPSILIVHHRGLSLKEYYNDHFDESFFVEIDYLDQCKY